MINLPFLFSAQDKLQRESFGIDHSALTDDQKMENIRWNVIALQAELFEMLEEVGWKPWATSTHIHTERALDEMVDALHFFMNLCLVVGAAEGMTAEAVGTYIQEGYFKKRKINAERQENGYDGVSSKCPSCHRELSEIPPTLHALGYCMCGAPLTRNDS